MGNNKAWKPLEYDEDTTGLADRLLDALKSPPPPIQNYVVYSPCGDGVGPKMFIHGRDIFSPGQAEIYYGESPEGKTSHFNQSAIDRLSAWLRPETLRERADYFTLMQYGMGGVIRELLLKKQEELEINPSDFPNLMAGNINIDETRSLMALLEKKNFNIFAEIEKFSKNHTPDFEEKKQEIQDFTINKLNEYKLSIAGQGTLESRIFDSLEGELWQYIEAHDYDWEIINNFRAAIQITTDENIELETLLESGIQARSHQILNGLVTKMSNPYDERFAIVEAETARTIVSSIQNRVLGDAIKCHTPILMTDKHDIAVFSDVLGIPLQAAGKYSPKHGSSALTDDFVLLSNAANDPQLTRLAAHEFEHRTDFAGAMTFARRHDGILGDVLARDSDVIKQFQNWLQQIPPEPSDDNMDQFKLRILAKRRGIDTSDLPEPPDDLQHIKQIMIKELDDIVKRLSVFIPEINPINADDYSWAAQKRCYDEAYNTDFSKALEVPAVVSELTRLYGGYLIGEVIPETYKLWQHHRNEAIGFGDKGSMAL